MPPELAARLESARASGSMVGERRVISMLFCDIQGSTAAAEQLDPEEWTEILNGAFEHMIRPIYQYEGTVARLMGDAILAFFGAPLAHEDDPRRAVLAGLEIHHRIRPYCEQVNSQHAISFNVRVGINTGLVVVGEIGSDLRMEYTAIGDAINLAARMEQTADPGTVQISQETYKLVAPFFECEPLGAIHVKGKTDPVQAYRVLGVKEVPGPYRGLPGLASPLVGRQPELALLQDCLVQLRQGRGAFVAVLGEAGLGKSTLLAEVRRTDAGHPLPTWLESAAFSYTRSTGYFLWRHALRQAIDVHQSETPAGVRARLGLVCDEFHLPADERPFLEALLAVESEQSQAALRAWQGEALQGRLAGALAAYLRAASRQVPLVLAFDDLHWADEASLTLLVALIELVAELPILLVCLLRPAQEITGWKNIEQAAQQRDQKIIRIVLEPLNAVSASSMLANLVGSADVPLSVQRLVLKKAEGNPLFVEELIRSLIETGQLVHENDRWRVTGEIEAIPLPNTLTGLIGARIDRLPEVPRRLLQTAAVIGRSFDLRVLGALAAGITGLEAHMQTLVQAGLLQPAAAQGAPEYAFRHALIQEAAYQYILRKQRLELHLRVGEIIEKLFSDQRQEMAPTLAHHFYAARDPRSAAYDLSAGDNAARLYANAEAAFHYTRALEMAPGGQMEHSQLARLYTQLGHVLQSDGQYERSVMVYQEMEAYARRSGDPRLELAGLTARAAIYSTFTTLYNPLLGEETLQQALELARKIGDQSAQAKLHWSLMLTYFYSKRLAEGLAHGQPALDLARQVGQPEQLAFALNDLGRLYTSLGEFGKSIAHLEEARLLWRQLDNQIMLADNLGAASYTHFFAGEYDRAIQLAAQAQQLSEQTENLWGQCASRLAIGYILLERGEPEQAIKVMTECVHLGDQSGLIASRIAMRADLAWVYGVFGAFERGVELARQAATIAESQWPDWKPYPVSVLVRLHLLQDDLAAARQLTSTTPLKSVPVPLPVYDIQVALAAAELALASDDPRQALVTLDELRQQVPESVRHGMPEVLYTVARAQLGLGQLAEARQSLVQARLLAETLGARHSLWRILALLAEVATRCGEATEAEQLRASARQVVAAIAGRLEDAGLRQSFLDGQQVRALSA